MALPQLWTSLNLQRTFIQPSLLTSLQWVRTLVTPTQPSTQPSNDASDKEEENNLLLDNLKIMGVDVEMAQKRQPGVLRKTITNERGLADFLQFKGASREVMASIISRFPRSISRSEQHLEERWQLWRTVFKSDSEIVSILDRSPESFFRSSDNDNLKKNIVFLTSLGLTSKDLHRLLTTAPRTFSNSVELNRQMVDLLKDVCSSLGGMEPSRFTKDVISKNPFILIRSTKRVRANVEFLQSSLGLTNSELLGVLQGHGAGILDLSHEILKRNFMMLQEKLVAVGGTKKDAITLIVNHASVLFISHERISDKLDRLLQAGITVKQIREKPRILDFSLENLRWRVDELRKVGYDFDRSGVAVLDSSRKRFEARLQKMYSVEE
ncbi:transcription termination factor 1, mitochondrial [Sardina pilchardus]|uniref:transcription termination factor 1, mitochondrial n=1 Tax=Sardina pilchardus TaxID=27697 RepID=UPI002E0DBF1D